MNLVGLYALLSVLVFRYFFKLDAVFFKNFTLGVILPSLLDSFFMIISLFFNSPAPYINYSFIFSHSLFVALILSTLFYLMAEIRRNRYYKIAGGGLLFGFLAHIVFDLFFWIEPIYIFWPILDKDLDMTIAGMLFKNDLDTHKVAVYVKFCFEFLFLLFYAKFLIEILIKSQSSAKIIRALNFYKNRQLNLFILFFILFFVFYCMGIDNLNLLVVIFNIAYFPSLLAITLITYKAKVAFYR